MSATLCRDCLTLATQAAPSSDSRCAVCRSPRLLAHAELAILSVAHIDCDAFYASVEKRDRPELAQAPVIVGGGLRGVVTTACYVARTFGVRSAMPMFKALKLCPNAVVIRPDFTKYVAESRRIMTMIRALTPLVQTLSLDEAWIDLAGSQRLHEGPPALTLARLQAAIARETGLDVSVGLAPNKFLAKIASELDKPKGFAVIGARDAREFLSDRPVAVLPGVGPRLAEQMRRDGLLRVGDIAARDADEFGRRYGRGGRALHAMAHGIDARPVDPAGERKSISAESTFDVDLSTLEALEDRLWSACEKVATRARSLGVAGRVVTLKLKRSDFRLVTRRQVCAMPIQTARSLFDATRRLLRDEPADSSYRLIGSGLSALEPEAAASPALFASQEATARVTETTVDRLRSRFGAGAVVSGRALKADRGLARTQHNVRASD